MKFDNKKRFLAVAGFVVLANGCGPGGAAGPGTVSPPGQYKWEFSQVEVNSTPIKAQVVNNSGENIFAAKVANDKVSDIFISKDGGATFKAITDFKAPRAGDKTQIFEIDKIASIGSVYAYEHGFVFVEPDNGIVVTDNEGKGLVAFKKGNDGIANEKIDREVVSGNMLVVGQQNKNTVIELPKATVTWPDPVATGGTLCYPAGQKINKDLAFIGISANGGFDAMFKGSGLVYRYKPGSLSASGCSNGETDNFDYEKKIKDEILAPPGTTLGTFAVTKNGALLFLYGKRGNADVTVVRFGAGPPVATGHLDFVNFWVHKGKQQLYGVFTTLGLLEADPATGDFSNTVTNATLIGIDKPWFKKAKPTERFSLPAPLYAYFETPKGNVVFVTDTGEMHVGVKKPIK